METKNAGREIRTDFNAADLLRVDKPPHLSYVCGR
jgi:hypothetical protein